MPANETNIMKFGKYERSGIERRTFIYSVSAIGAITLAGCIGEEGPAVDDDEENDIDDDGPEDDVPDDDLDYEEDPEEVVEEEEEIEDLEAGTATVEVDYDGEWRGVIETLTTSEEYEGEGPESFEVEIDPEYDILHAWFQKLVSGDESREITVRVSIDDEVIIEETTDGHYGLARVRVEID